MSNEEERLALSLIELYVRRRIPAAVIGKRMNFSESTIRLYLAKFGITKKGYTGHDIPAEKIKPMSDNEIFVRTGYYGMGAPTRHKPVAAIAHNKAKYNNTEVKKEKKKVNKKQKSEFVKIEDGLYMKGKNIYVKMSTPEIVQALVDDGIVKETHRMTID